VILILNLPARAGTSNYSFEMDQTMPDPYHTASSQFYSGVNNAGIGTTSPIEMLDVLGDIRIGGQANQYLGALTPQAMLSLYNYNYGLSLFSTTGSGLKIFTEAGSDIEIGSLSSSISWPYTASTPVPYTVVESTFIPTLTINSAGHVGVGTTTPTGILTVGSGGRLQISNSASDTTVLGSNDADTTLNSRITITGDSASTGGGDIQYYAQYPAPTSTSTAQTGGNHMWYSSSAAGSQTTLKMMLNSSGQLGIGIGTSTPVAILGMPQINSGSTSDPIIFYYTGTNKNFGLGATLSGSPSSFQIHSDQSNSDIVFGTGSSTEFSEIMRIKGNTGYVGIGTTTPDQFLSVNRSVNVDASSTGTGVLNPGFTFGSSTGAGIASNRSASGTGYNSQGLDFYTNSAIRMQIDHNGNVGIGTLSPSYPLDVGTSTATTTLNYKLGQFEESTQNPCSSPPCSITGGISIYSTYVVYAQEFDATSDRRLKENISDVTGREALKFIRGAHPTHFRWKDSKLPQYGFIAQDMIRLGFTDQVVPVQDPSNPFLKATRDTDGLISPEGIKLTLNYSEFSALLTQGAKIVLSQLEELEEKFKPKFQELSHLKQQNEQWERALDQLDFRLKRIEEKRNLFKFTQ
jgi:hypothetical protein